jgi:hypothetical protein
MPVVNKQLIGIAAVEYLANKYDWNVYCPDYNRVNIIAYRQRLEGNGSLTYDSTHEVIFKQDMSIDWTVFIGLVLRDDSWSDKGWYEYDSWEGDPHWVAKLYTESTPFANWFEENIVDYDIEYKENAGR